MTDHELIDLIYKNRCFRTMVAFDLVSDDIGNRVKAIGSKTLLEYLKLVRIDNSDGVYKAMLDTCDEPPDGHSSGRVNRIVIVPLSNPFDGWTEEFTSSPSCFPLPSIDNDPFMGCDGKPNTDENLRVIMTRLVESEDYEEAVKYRDELARRAKIKEQ